MNLQNRIIFVAGPYKAYDNYTVSANIMAAQVIGVSLIKLGGFPLIPQCNTAHLEDVASEKFFYEGYKKLLVRCDGICLTSRWRDSRGAIAELDLALSLLHDGEQPFIFLEATEEGVVEVADVDRLRDEAIALQMPSLSDIVLDAFDDHTDEFDFELGLVYGNLKEGDRAVPFDCLSVEKRH